MALSETEVELFHRQGFLVVGPLVSPSGVDALRGALTVLWERWAAELGVTVGEYCRVVSQWTNLWRVDPCFAAQMRSPECTAMAAQLVGCSQVRVFHDHVISKPPVHSKAVPWHQDYPYWPIGAPRAVSLWLALDPVTADSGCMHFMPGAHREGEGRAVDFLNDRKDWAQREGEVIATPIPAGWGVFHHCLSWHTTPENATAAARRAYISIYMDVNSVYDPSHSGWHPMNDHVTVAPGEVFNSDVFPVVGGLG